MASNKGSKGILTSAIAGLSTVSITVLQYNPMSYESGLIDTLSTCSPVISATIISALYWLFLQGNGETIEQKTLNNKLSRQIKFLRKQIKTNKKEKIEIKDLHLDLNELIKAKAKQYN